ncbi:MAG: hypothetical protein VX294_14415 [Candidatus Latescibacterota bacterium]|nr:hypothetical protein [Candidatus Latescibacterota bacterium]
MLTYEQRQRFYESGYIVLRQIIPAKMIENVLRSINYSIGEEGLSKEDLPRLRQQSYCNEIQKRPIIVDLCNKTKVFPCVESLLGTGNVEKVKSGQIALRFPIDPQIKTAELNGHLDGLGTGVNGSAKGSYGRKFTSLAVCLLSDLKTGFSGNFTVWPRSHTFFKNYFEKYGHQVLQKGMPKIDLPEDPIMIEGRPGDVVITHHQLVHAAAPNLSSNVRYAAIFRLHHIDCNKNGNDSYTDIWREWPGIQALENL